MGSHGGEDPNIHSLSTSFWVPVAWPHLTGLSERFARWELPPNSSVIVHRACPQTARTFFTPSGRKASTRNEATPSIVHHRISPHIWWTLQFLVLHLHEFSASQLLLTPSSADIPNKTQACFRSKNISLRGAFDFIDACESCPGLCFNHQVFWPRYEIAASQAKFKHKYVFSGNCGCFATNLMSIGLMGLKTFFHCYTVLFLKWTHALHPLLHQSEPFSFFCHLLEIPNIPWILQLR